MAEPLLPSAVVAEIVRRCDRQSQRRRCLPAELVAWLIVAAGLWRAEGLRNVLASLGRTVFAGLAWARRTGCTPSSAAIARARSRLGVRPLRRMLQRMVALWLARRATALRWRGLALVALDGTTLRMPDSAANRAHFGTHRTGARRRASAYPFAAMVVALCAVSHVVLACAVGAANTSEWVLVRQLLRKLPKRCLLLLDRGFMGYALLQDLARRGHEFVVRAKSGRRLHRRRRLGPSDHLACLHLSRAQLRGRPDLAASFQVRVITYRRRGFRPVTLLTSLIDPLAFPAEERVARYRDRWEVELTFDEVKTHLLARHVSLRSKSPVLVRQEIDGVLIAHNLVRMHMEAAATQARLPPRRLSYTDALTRLRDLHRRMASAPVRRLPELMADAIADLATCILPPRRPRTYPRAIKAIPCRYPIRKRGRAA
jgi:hypothetical protein